MLSFFYGFFNCKRLALVLGQLSRRLKIPSLKREAATPRLGDRPEGIRFSLQFFFPPVLWLLFSSPGPFYYPMASPQA
ncbi:hypothetical protein C8R31_104262 [Nitrosospira sp. Nsp2]|nr:hypothetical protein C8R31_104262 [Nitrosospira sp. Nsp2]